MLWTHTQGSPSSNSRQFPPVIVTALMHQPPRPPVLAVVHAGQIIAHGVPRLSAVKPRIFPYGFFPARRLPFGCLLLCGSYPAAD